MDNQTTSQTEKPVCCPPGCCSGNRWFKPVAIIIGILIVIGLFGNIYLLLQKPKSVEQSMILPSPTTAQVIVAPTLAIDETVNWKTYTNTKYKYGFKYPQDISLEEKANNSVLLTKVGPTQKEATEFYDGINLQFFPGKLENQTFDEFAKSSFASEKKSSEEDPGGVKIVRSLEATVINGLNGYTFTIRGLGTFKTIYLQSPFTKDLFIKIVDGTNDPTGKGFQKIVDQILSTFRFD